MVHPTCLPFRPRSTSPRRTWYAHCSCRSQYIVRFRPSDSTADSRAKISSEVRRASTLKTKGGKRKKRATRLKSIFFVQTPLMIPLASMKNVARPMRQMGDEEEMGERVSNTVQIEGRIITKTTITIPIPINLAGKNDKPTQNTAQTLDSPGTRPMNALSTL
jgi:hypothetical protein